ncbi:MAG: hypothetical protein ABIT96_00215 [Ferruginibacter sp.]
MKLFFLFLFTASALLAHAQQKNIVVHFLYGSTPANGYEKTEKNRFGGKKGGHVSLEAGDSIIGFQPKGNCHLVAMNNLKNGYFRADDKNKWLADTVGNKYTSILIPVSDEQYALLKNTLNNYLDESPYDYAFLGMRCAAATSDILEQIGILDKKNRTAKWTSNFYPQLFRRQMLKLAEDKNYTIVRHEGRNSRKWEME